jgi:hypothetical protein
MPEIKEIRFHEILNPLARYKWRCHIKTKDGSHFEGEGYIKEEAEQNAMALLRANRNL